MSLITDDWRLKLLAVGLAVLMLGAVAFSQNPPTTGSLTVGMTYTMPTNLILINPPTRTNFTYSGLADVIKNVNTSNSIATVDVTHASPGTAVRLPVRITTITGVSVQNPSPIVVNVDALQIKDVPVQVNATTAPGWTLTKHDAVCPGQQPNPCVVHFHGPATWETNLIASVTIPGQLNVTRSDSTNWPIQLRNSNGDVDLTTCHTNPCAYIDITSVGVLLEASPGSTSTTVPLVDAPYIGAPAAGYHVVGITISPGTVILTGDAVALGKIQRIVLPAIDLSGRSSNYNVQVQIPYPANVSGAVTTATIVYQIAANPAVSPAP